VHSPSVFAKPRVAILSTGSELLDASEAVEAHQLRNSNGPMLVAGLRAAAFDVTCCRAVDDNEETILSTINSLLTSCEVLILTGGVSVGKYDLVPNAIERAGGTVHFHGVGIKPGRPQLFATTGEGRILYGLPGNPLSSMLGLQEFIIPTLRRLAGWPPAQCRPRLRVRLGGAISGKAGRERHVLAALTWDAAGGVATPVPSRGSADLVAGAKADGVVIVPAETECISVGALVDFSPWRPLQ